MGCLEERPVTEPQPPAPRGTATGSDHQTRPRIYVACLAAYNNGKLHGRWIVVTDPDDVRHQVADMLAASPEPGAEEWSIHDSEGFEGAELSEWANFETVCDLADFIAEHGELGAKLYAHFGNDLEQAGAQFDDYAGEYASLGAFAEDLHDSTRTELPDDLRYYMDWDARGRDLELSGDVFAIETGFEQIHIFWSR